MTRRFPRALGPLLALVLLALAGCGAGGFGDKNPETLDSSISSYVALGDGFVAAPYTGTTSDAACLRSADNYPALVARELGVNNLQDVSCAGSGTRALANKFTSPYTRKSVPAQLDAISRDTDLVTVGTGLLDRNLVNRMFHICMALPCPSSAVAAKDVLNQLTLYGDSLTSALRSIQDEAPAAYIVVVGYPQLLPTDEGCAKIPAVSDAQLDAANLVFQRINATLQSAARQTGSAFVNVAGLSANHNACSDVPWVTGKDAKKGKSVAWSPLRAEQEAVAKAIADQVRSR